MTFSDRPTSNQNSYLSMFCLSLPWWPKLSSRPARTHSWPHFGGFLCGGSLNLHHVWISSPKVESLQRFQLQSEVWNLVTQPGTQAASLIIHDLSSHHRFFFEVLRVSQTQAGGGEQTVIPSAVIHLWLSLQHQFTEAAVTQPCNHPLPSCPPCAQVFASQPTAHHGPHLCVAVLPLWADLGWQSLLAPPANSAHGQNDALQDLPGVPAELPPNLQLHPLPSSPGQPRRAHLQGNRRQQRHSAPVTWLNLLTEVAPGNHQDST